MFSLSIVSAFANYPLQVSVLLDPGATTVAITNSGSTGGSPLTMQFSPGVNERVRFTISPIYVPPLSSSTYSACSDPCGVSINRQWGQQYFWVEYVNTSGNPFSPRKISEAAGAYASNTCGGLGTLPMVEPAVTTAAPLPMPREVIGQDCYVDRVRLPLTAGHASTNLRLWVRLHSPIYNTVARSDGKLSVQVNGGAWITLANSNSAVRCADEQCYFNRQNATYADSDFTTPPLPFGGYPQVRDYIVDLPNGTVSASDTTVEIAWRFNGTEGNESGSRILEMAPIEGTDHALTQIVTTSNVSVATSAAHGLSSGDSVLVRGAPGMRMVYNGYRTLTAATANTFTFTPCGQGSGGSRLAACTSPNGTFKPPVNRNPIQNFATDQAFMYATRMLVPASAFTYVDPTTWTAPAGGNATRGGNLFKYGNAAGTPGQFDQLVNPQLPYLNYTLHFAKCADCHSPTGKDLKYFNFSNFSVAQRSYFHGISEQDGLDIAAYIRGLDIAVPLQARPWNPPLQTGPGMDNGTWKKSDGTLTNIVVTSNHAVATTTVDPKIKVGDPLNVSGATVQANLNTQTLASATWKVTAVTPTTISFDTTGVANGTYTESTLIINMANDFVAGCGVDCVTTYAYGEVLASLGTDRSKWVWNSYLDPRIIVYPWLMADWNKGWLPTIHPADAVPSAGYLISTPYTHFQSLLTCLTPGNFATYKSCGYGDSLFGEYLGYWGRDPGTTGNTLPDTTDKFIQLPPQAPGWVAPSIFNLFRQSVIQANLMAEWTLAVEYGTIGMFAQMQTDRFGPATAAGCYPQWGFAPKAFVFNIGSHKVKMNQQGIVDGRASSYMYASNVWYVATPAINGGGCLDSPDDPIDNGYYLAFFDTEDLYRAGGYVTMLISPILTPQSGRQQPHFSPYLGAGTPGTDWMIFLYNIQSRYNYYWFTAAEYGSLWDSLINMAAAEASAHDATYWNTVMTRRAAVNGGTTACIPGAAWQVGNPQVCESLTAAITWAKLFSTPAGAADLTAYVNWAKSIPVFSTNYFDAALAAATQGDTGDYGTGNLSVAGPGKTITFSSFCPGSASTMQFPNLPVVIGSSGGEVSELLYPTGGTCAGRGGAGTLTFTTQRPHTGTIWATWGCNKTHLEPNWNFLNDTQTRVFKCSNMI